MCLGRMGESALFFLFSRPNLNPCVETRRLIRSYLLPIQHKLNSWRESMNSHLSGRGLDGVAK